MQHVKFIVLLVLASPILANKLIEGSQCEPDSCLAAVTGRAALSDDSLRAEHCKFYLTTTVTPDAIVTTTTITEDETTETAEHTQKFVTVCPYMVPKYASVCSSGNAYASACSCFSQGIKTVTTLDPTTTTKTVYARPSNGDKPMGPGLGCLRTDKANYLVDSFVNFLEFTNYDGSRGGPKGRGFNTDLAKMILAEDFLDISDSINLLAQQPLGTVTFPSRDAFIAGQSVQPEVQVTVLDTWFSCNTITFRYRLLTGLGPNLPVVGINVMEIDKSLNQIKVNYAEFNSGAWLVDLGNPQCQTPGGNGTSTGSRAGR